MRINLDHYVQTPILPIVKQAMAESLEQTANPSSIHEAGRKAKQLIEKSRRQVAALINALPEEIYFTSCATESNNWAIRGLFGANKRKGSHLVSSAIEHPSVTLPIRRLEMESGARADALLVDSEGFASPAALKELLTPETVLVSVMLANGEVGTVEPIKELAAVAREQGALFHTDATAAVGNIPVDVKSLGVDALSFSANSFCGAPGAAALFVRHGVRILSLLEGGGQEQGGRSGMENVPAIVGMGVAAELAREQLSQRMSQATYLRDHLLDGLQQRIDGLRINGPVDLLRLPNNLHICIDGVASESLVLSLDQAGIAAGLGSACNSKSMRPSHVLKAMGLTDEQAKGALVLTVGLETTQDDIDRAIEIIPEVVKKLRSVTALTARI